MKQYGYEDKTPYSGMNHYRLNMRSRDGRSAYSKIVAVNNVHGSFVCSAAPNPVTDKLTISVNDFTGNASVSVEDMTGKTIEQVTMNTARCVIDMSSLTPGIYLIRYKDGTHSELFKIVK